MKIKRLLAGLFCALFAWGALLPVTPAGAYAPETGEGCLIFDYSAITGGVVNHTNVAKVEKNVTKDGVNAVRVTPNTVDPDKTIARIGLDCYSLGSSEVKVEVPKYRFVGVTYYYDAPSGASYDGPMVFRLLPGSTGAVADVTASSIETVVANRWTEAYFSFADAMKKLPETDKPYLSQVHLRPFGDTPPTKFKSDESVYIAKITFYENNPDPNAAATVDFLRGDPGAAGECAPMRVGSGVSYMLPENPFSYDGAVFLGWKYSLDGEVYAPGAVMTAPDFDVRFTAQWKVTADEGDFITLDFVDYANGTVNNNKTAVLEAVEKDGRDALRIAPDPAFEGTTLLTVDGYSCAKARIDLEQYKWFAVEYLYETAAPINTKMLLRVLNNGNVLSVSERSVSATEPLVAGHWAIALFDFSSLSDVLNPNLTEHFLRQMHLRPFGNINLQKDVKKDDIMYVSRVIFFKEKPAFVTHAAYMNGYEDGTFRPSATMTRAEACTVVARLLAPEEEIAGVTSFADVPADAWFAKYVGFCEGRGLLSSYSGSFLPDRPITRAEFAELVYLTGLSKTSETAVSFPDVPPEHPRYASIAAAASAGLIRGYEDGAFRPDNTVTRAEVVTVVNRARTCDRAEAGVSEDLTLLFLDVDNTHWAFANIAEATVPHVEWNGAWVYPAVDPVKVLLEKVDAEALYRIDEGDAKVKELDELEEKRIAEIRATPSDLARVTGKTYYVASDGSDDAAGTETAPFRTITRANNAAGEGDAVLLRRGDIFREKFVARAGVTYSAYGAGEKPRVYGSPENGAAPDKWRLVYENGETGALIWKYADETMNDVGTLVFDGGRGFAKKVLATCVDGKYVVRGDPQKKPFDYTVELDSDLAFFHAADSAVSGGIITASAAVGPLYLRCDSGNPGKVFDEIEFNTKGNVITVGGSGVTVDNLCIMYGGSHGIGSATTKDLTVTNCEVAWIGGSIQAYNANGKTDGSATRFGNGVEVYGGCERYRIENCYVHECYDAGVTHQLSSRTTSGDYEMNDVTYRNNLITECVYSVEYFFGVPAESDLKREGKNILIENNLMRRAGFGFGSYRPDGNNQRHIRSGSSNNRFSNFTVRGNIFDRSVHELLQTEAEFLSSLPKMEGNTYIVGIGNRFFTYGKKIAYADLAARGAVRNVLKDETGVLYFVENTPYWTYGFAPSRTAPVTDADRGGK